MARAKQRIPPGTYTCDTLPAISPEAADFVRHLESEVEKINPAPAALVGRKAPVGRINFKIDRNNNRNINFKR